ncbi:transposase, putative [Ixodes scapularis]|uniref:Transposase, putative n=1 Tax=Ixodes scapularis TaxID=6945 RepID=B7PXI4_IXOSC|nr:transposase, putative [Ixodes scapularis]|eukprot:XP_002400959.1 transposase, putative [Ixodes scapularis]
MDNPATRTNNAAGENSIRIANTSCARRGFTVALAARASGAKLPAFVVLKEPTGRIPARAFMALRIPMIDQAPIHKTKAVMDTAEASATDIVHIPGGCTGILQPADVYWNKSFKDSLCTSWAEFMGKGDKTPKGNLRKPSRQDVLNFVSKDWAAVLEDMIAQSFKGCGISDALDGSEDGYLHNGLAGIGAQELLIEC